MPPPDDQDKSATKPRRSIKHTLIRHKHSLLPLSETIAKPPPTLPSQREGDASKRNADRRG